MSSFSWMYLLPFLLVSIYGRIGTVLWVCDMTVKNIDPDQVPWEERDSRLPEYTPVSDKQMRLSVKFNYYTRRNPDKPEILTPGIPNNVLQNNLRKPFKLIIHGYIDSPRSPKIIHMRKKLLEVLDVNVIAVDWSSISRQKRYLKVAKDTHKIGRFTASFLDWLTSQGVSPSDIHVIGHSLGAHVSGFAGQFTRRGKIGRITGLDPALPGFIAADKNSRLDPTDAQFVDCIHTCGGELGFIEPICHADFYPNGGRNLQPGCLRGDTYGVCSHFRATKYFIESIDPSYTFQAAQCPIEFEGPMNCTWSNYNMGYYLDPSARGMFYVKTNMKWPFSRVPFA